MSTSDEALDVFIKRMPKVELHAHLNGSFSQNTLQKLVELKQKASDDTHKENLIIPSITSNDLSQCFQMFSLIHKITVSPEAVYMATCDVIEDFYNDGVRYLELRTTPKDCGISLTQDVYVETVLKAIEDTCSQTCPRMCVKLLLSIDRKRPVTTAEETVKVAERFCTMSSAVVGIDLSGDPRSGDIKDFIPILSYAKKLGLKLAVHISEIPNMDEEVGQLLRLHPHRLGHGTCLHPLKKGSVANFELLKKLEIPLEICLTSNVICKTVPSYENHHFPLFKEINYPVTFCTDDKGIFNTSLSKEYNLASKYYSLTKEDLFNISYASINYMFSEEALKNELKDELKLFWKQNMNEQKCG